MTHRKYWFALLFAINRIAQRVLYASKLRFFILCCTIVHYP
jgi:hypothetical protein